MRAIWIILLLCTSIVQNILGSGDDRMAGDSNLEKMSPRTVTLTNIAGCLDHVRDCSDAPVPLRVKATITLVDQARRLIVLQDDSAAMAVDVPPADLTLLPGQRVCVQGAAVFPSFQAFPAFPDQPSERHYLHFFEEPTNHGTFYLSRIRGYLHPPVTGRYTFWIASDDAGKLFLSPDASPGRKHSMAENQIGNSAASHDWDHYSSQRSKPVQLKAGQTYYVEALHEQNYGDECLAVAWAGPGIKRSVIDGDYLTPWVEAADTVTGTTNGSVNPAHGLFYERWTNYFVGDLPELHSPATNQAIVRIHSPRFTEEPGSKLPAPVEVTPQMSLDAVPNWRWVELEGQVEFAAGNQHGCRVQLNRGGTIVDARILDWSGPPAERLVHASVRIRGVLEHAYDSDDRVSDSLIWVPDNQMVSLLALPENSSQDSDFVSICNIVPSNPLMNWGRQVRVRGRITGRTTNDLLVLEGDDNYQGFYSKDGTNWIPLGMPVEIGMSNSVLAGLAVASQSSSTLAAARFRDLQGWGTNWMGTEIGRPQIAGQFAVRAGMMTVKGGGTQIWARKDQQYLAYQYLAQPFELSANLCDLQPGKDSYGSHTQVGIMARESLNRRAPYASVLFSPVGGPVFQYRRGFGDYSARSTEAPVYHRMCWMKLVKRKSVLLAQGYLGADIHIGQQVEAAGIVAWHHNTPILAQASFMKVRQNHSPPESVIKITQRSISIADFSAKALHPPKSYRSNNLKGLNLHGIVSFCGDVMGQDVVCVQGKDGSGILVDWPDNGVKPKLTVGQLVEMNGYARVHQFPVVFNCLGLRGVGWGTFPEPTPYSADLLNQENSQARWVVATGVMRAQGTNGSFNVMTSEGPLSVWFGKHHQSNHCQYVDSLVRVRGVLSFNSPQAAQLLVPGPDFTEVLEPSPTDSFSIPRFAIAQLAGVKIKPNRLRRMKLEGVVTCVLPQGVYVQDQSGGALVQPGQRIPLHPGDRVEVVGFPENDSVPLTFQEAKIQKLGVAGIPQPIRLTSREIIKNNHPGVLVSVKAKLIEQYNVWGRQTLVLQSGKRIIEAALVSEGSEPVPAIPNGSLLSITGICHAGKPATQSGVPSVGLESLPSGLKMWLPSASDVVVLARPPWWTLKRVAWLGGMFAFALLGALVWVRILRRRIAERTRQLQATMLRLEKESRASAVLAERDRLAGEIHDSLEQGLTAIMLQLDMARQHAQDVPAACEILRVARNMAEFSRAEVQHAVWNIQSPLLDNADLGSALKHLARQIDLGSPGLSVQIVGAPRNLPSSHEHHLLRIAQEAITNAVKHSGAKNIKVILEFRSDNLQLSIADDGAGFIPAAVKPDGSGGRFGLQGIRVRANKIAAQLDVVSQIGKGTVITVGMKFDPDPLVTVFNEGNQL